MEEFTIKKVNGSIVLQKNNNGLQIMQTMDNDIWFLTPQDKYICELKLSSRDYNEWQIYLLFENLMKSIIGRYMLNEHYKKDCSMLPKDFIDLENKTIIWHSDSGTKNVLKFKFEHDIITIYLLKDKNAKDYVSNIVRIRTSGSNYKYYYQEFTHFFNQLTLLENRLNFQEQPKVRKLTKDNN